MTTYKQIFGKPVKYLSTDPTDTGAEGQIWYNSTSGTFKSVLVTEAWSSGSSYLEARPIAAGTGTQTAALGTGDTFPSPAADSQKTFEYNGYNWTTGGSTGTARQDIQANMSGSQTAAIITGGRPSASPAPFGITATEEYDGSTWTAGGAYPAEMRGLNMFGIQTNAVAAGGNSANPSIATNVNNEYDGSTWTAGNNNSTARFQGAVAGIQTAGILFGGFTPSPPGGVAETEEYNGSAWTTGGSLGTAVRKHGGGGTQTNTISFGGLVPTPAKTTATEKYDGTSWSTSPATLSTAIDDIASAKTGSGDANLSWAGSAGGGVLTEEYNKDTFARTASSWASGGSLSSARRALTMFGHQTAAVVAGGAAPPGTPPAASATEEYNGSSWSSGGALPAASPAAASAGSLTTGLLFGPGTQSLQYDGSTWTAGNSLNSPISLNMGSGTQTAAFSAGGSPAVTQTELYNGTTWTTATGALNTGRSFGQAAGNSAAGLVYGGETGPGVGAEVLASESWDGTSWTATNPMANVAVAGTAGGGTQTQAFSALGAFVTAPGPDSLQTQTQEWDGTGWATTANATTARWQTSGSGPASDGGLAAGGTTGTLQTATEEYTYTTTTLNFKTLTTS